MKRTRKITDILDPDRRVLADFAYFGAIRDSLPKKPTLEEYEAASASERATMNPVIQAHQLIERIMGALRTQGRYDWRDAEQLEGLVREISMRPHAVRDVERHEAEVKGGAAGGRKGGFKGGRPSAKPSRVELAADYKRHRACGNDTEARANLVKELQEETGKAATTVRGWLRDAGI